MTVAEQSYAPILEASQDSHTVSWLPVEDGDLVVKVQVDGVWVNATYTVSEKMVTVTTSGYTHVFIYRKTKVSQNTQFLTLGDFSPKIHADAFDKLTRMVQEIDDTLDKRVVKLETDKDDFTPVIKGGVPVGGLMTATADGFEVSTEKATAMDEAVGTATTQAEKSKTSADTSEAWAQGTPSLITGNDDDKSSKDWTGVGEGFANKSETALDKIVAVTGVAPDPQNIHAAHSIVNIADIIGAFAYGDKFSWDWKVGDINQYSRVLSSIKGFPSEVVLGEEDLSLVVKAYIYERWGYTPIPSGQTLSHGVKVTDDYIKDHGKTGADYIKLYGRYDDDGKDREIEDTGKTKVLILPTELQRGNAQTPLVAILINSYGFTAGVRVANELDSGYSDDPNAFEVNKSQDSSGKDVYTLNFDGQSIPKGTIITFEIDIDGAKEYLEKARAVMEQVSHLEDKAEAIVHGRYVEFNIGVDTNGKPAFTDGHFTVQQSKDLGLTALVKGTKYTFNVRDIPLISHWLPDHLIPSDGKNFFQTVILKTADIGANDRYIRRDFITKKIPDNRKVGDVKLKAKSKASDGAILDISSFPTVDFTPEFNGIHTITFEELSAKWFLDKSADFKALYQAYVASSKNYSEGMNFKVTVPTTGSPTAQSKETLQARLSDKLAEIDGNTDRLPYLTKEKADFKGVFTPTISSNAIVTLDEDSTDWNLNPHDDGYILEANYDAPYAGTLVVTVTLDGGKQWFAKTKVEVGAAQAQIEKDLEPIVTKAEGYAEKLNIFLNGGQGSVDLDKSGEGALNASGGHSRHIRYSELRKGDLLWLPVMTEDEIQLYDISLSAIDTNDADASIYLRNYDWLTTQKGIWYGPKVGIVNYKTITVTIRLKSYKEILADQNTSYETKLAILNKFFGTTYKSVADFPADFKTLPALYSDTEKFHDDSKGIFTKIEFIDKKVTSAIASIGKAVVHISGTTFQKVGSAFVFHDTHVSQVANTLPVFTLGIADRNIFFLLNNTTQPAYPSLFGANERIQFQLPSVLDVSRVLTDPSETLSNDNPYIYKDFSFTIRILGGTGAKGLAVHSGVVNVVVNGTPTQVEDFIDDEDGSATTSGTKVTKNYDGQSALLTFHAKYDINKINQSQNWVVEHTVVGAGASTGLLKKTDADGYYLARRYLSQILLSTNKLNNMGRTSGSVKTALDLKADASALDAKADKSSTREWLIINYENQAQYASINDLWDPNALSVSQQEDIDNAYDAADAAEILQRFKDYGELGALKVTLPPNILIDGGNVYLFSGQTINIGNSYLFSNALYRNGFLLHSGTMSVGKLLDGGTMSGGFLLHRGTMSVGLCFIAER